ncbi:MAG: hypothetical protein NTV01_04530 [Bacteroidia bacterium]|nr:hypothetical protein [Bacteroidia bacterium]
MKFGTDTLVYIIIGVIFVLAQAVRKRNIAKGKPQAPSPIVKEESKEVLSAFWKEFLGTDLTANQVPEPVRINPVPPVFTEPVDFHRNEPAIKELVLPKSSFNDPGDYADAGLQKPARLPDEDQQFSRFDLRSAVVYSVILERKYV